MSVSSTTRTAAPSAGSTIAGPAASLPARRTASHRSARPRSRRLTASTPPTRSDDRRVRHGCLGTSRVMAGRRYAAAVRRPRPSRTGGRGTAAVRARHEGHARRERTGRLATWRRRVLRRGDANDDRKERAQPQHEADDQEHEHLRIGLEEAAQVLHGYMIARRRRARRALDGRPCPRTLRGGRTALCRARAGVNDTTPVPRIRDDRGHE